LKRAEQGKPTPALEAKPDIYEDLIEVWQAFVDLSRSRQSGFGVSAISTSDILAWCDIHRISKDERAEFYGYIRALDNHLIAKELEDKKQANK